MLLFTSWFHELSWLTNVVTSSSFQNLFVLSFISMCRPQQDTRTDEGLSALVLLFLQLLLLRCDVVMRSRPV